MKGLKVNILIYVLAFITTGALTISVSFPYGGLDDVVATSISGMYLIKWIGIERVEDSPLVYKAFFFKSYLIVYLPFVYVLIVKVMFFCNDKMKDGIMVKVLRCIIATIIAVALLFHEVFGCMEVNLINSAIWLDFVRIIGFSVCVYQIMIVTQMIFSRIIMILKNYRGYCE